MTLPAAAGTTTTRRCGCGVAGGRPTEEGGTSSPEQQRRRRGGGAHHRRNEGNDGYRRGQHHGWYNAAGGGWGNGVVGRAIEGVRRLRSAISVINAGHSCGHRLIGHHRGHLSCLWVSCVSFVWVDSTFRTIPTVGILRGGSFLFPPKPIGVKLFNGWGVGIA